MANTLNKTGITTGNTVEAYHVTQSIDAFTGIVEYDIALSGSFNLTGSMTIDGLSTSSVLNILTFDPSTKALYTTSSIGFLQPLSSSIYNNTTNILINSSSIYNLSSSISSIPTSSGNFANTDLTFTGNRSHNTDGNILEITTDNGLYGEAWFYMQEGGVEEGTWIGYNDSYMKTNSNGNILEVRGKTVVQTLAAFTVNDSSNSSFDFIVKGGTDSNLFFTNTATDKIGIGTNTPNAKLDVNGNTIITGSLNNGQGNLSSGVISHAEGFQTTASGLASHAEGYLSIASGSFSHAEGEQTLAMGNNSHAEGQQTIASGEGSHAEGYLTTASGDYAHSQGGNTQALGNYSLACGAFSIAYKDYSTALGISFASGSIQTTLGINNIRSDNDLSSTGNIFIIGNGPLIGSPSNAFRVSGSGECFSGTTFTNGGADYAEYFESHDGKSIPLGTVVELTGSYIKVCETAENAIGVISNKPSILGNGDEGTGDQWVGMYLKDEWGNYLYESYTFEVPLKVDKDGNPITQKGTRKVLNPNYNPSQNYLPRATRPEWNVVGLLGQIKVLKNQNIPLRWIKMKDINNNIAIYLVK